jgi:hypothetical protein
MITDPNASYQKQLFLIILAFAYGFAHAKDVDLRFPPQRFHRGISERNTWILRQDLDTDDCDGERAMRNSRVADETGKAMAHSAVVGPSTLRPRCRD